MEETPARPPFLLRRPRRGTRAAVVVAMGLMAWALGLGAFSIAIPDDFVDDGGTTDAIVVLTGGTLRLEEGFDLLAQGRAQKLFISGVYRGVEVHELQRLSHNAPALDCCITLGYTADDTRGNARETAEWIDENGFRSLRLVTASYHMPRSLVEFRSAIPDARIVAHPVFPPHVKVQRWWRWPGTASLVLAEYHKYLAARARAALRSLAGLWPTW